MSYLTKHTSYILHMDMDVFIFTAHYGYTSNYIYVVRIELEEGRIQWFQPRIGSRESRALLEALSGRRTR